MKPFLMLLASSALSLGLSGVAHSAVLYSTGFESPTFVPGLIEGQGGWSVFSASGQPGFAQIESGVARSGTQAAVVFGSAGSQTGPYYSLTLPSPGVIELSADLRLAPSTSRTSWQFAATGPGLVGFAGGIDIDENANILAISGAFPIIGSFSYDTWHLVNVILNYASQKFNVTLDGLTLATGLAFCGSNGNCTGANVANFGVGIFDSFGGSTTQALGYLDNFSIATAAVPEPAGWAMLAGGLGILGSAMRRRAAKAAPKRA